MAKHKGEPVGWVTANGKHIPKWEDGSIGWDNDEEEKNKKSSTSNKYADMDDEEIYERSREAREKYERTIERRREAERLLKEASPENKEMAQRSLERIRRIEDDRKHKAMEAAREADNRKEKKIKSHDESKMSESHKKTTGKESEKSLTDQMKEANKKQQKEFDEAHRALTKHQKINTEWEEKKRRSEQGIPTKYGTPDHSKLDQHSEIQKMADEHVEKIWGREGGAYNKELYDEADKFAEKHNFNKEKVRKAAFNAMNDKDLEASRLDKAGKDPLEAVKARKEAREAHLKNGMKKKETTAPAKISDKSRKVADNARKSLIWDNGRDYVEIAENQWQWAGMSNEAVVKALNATDDKYIYEYKQDQSTGAFMMPNAKVNHHKIYRKKKK